jgi:hypothetical protein
MRRLRTLDPTAEDPGPRGQLHRRSHRGAHRVMGDHADDHAKPASGGSLMSIVTKL